MSAIPIVLYTDVADVESNADVQVIRFESPSYSYADKIRPLLNLPFDRTLFLDTDTYACCSFMDLFELADRFDVVAAHDPWRIGPPVDAPQSFPELNTGVILLRRSPVVQDLISDWLRRHLARVVAEPSIGDQASFREAVYQSRISLYVVPSEYNFRTFCVNFAGNTGVIRILHGDQRIAVQIEAKVNVSRDFRLYVPSISSMTDRSIVGATRNSRGLLSLIGVVSRLLGGIRSHHRSSASAR